MNLNNPLISLVVPVYQEEANIRPFLSRAETVLNHMRVSYEIIFVLDPCSDKTEEVILEEIARNPNIKLIVLSRRFGQPVATMAGILSCIGETCCIIDADLQDPPELIESLYEKLNEGYEVVYAKRRSRRGEGWIKRMTAYVGYFLINKLSDLSMPRNTGDFRIITRRVIEELRRLNESHCFLRGLVSYVGFNQSYIEYNRDPRHAGKGHYNRFLGSFKIGLNGLIGFSSRPLFLMLIAGMILTAFSFILGIGFFLEKLIKINLTLGLSKTELLITFFSGIQLLSLGLVGEYVGRIYDEVKRRPLYIIDKKVGF